MTDHPEAPEETPPVEDAAEPEAVGAEPVAGGAEPAEDYLAPEARRRPLVLLAVALLVVATALGAMAATLYSRLQAERSDREDVAEVSGRFGEALLSYDFNDLPAAKRRVLADATGRFRSEYERAFTGGLDVLLRETQARSRGTVLDVFVSEIEDDNAKAIAVVTAQAEGIGGRRQAADSYIQLDLVKVKGEWKVDGVTNLNFGQAAPGASTPPSAPAPSTTAPPQ